MREGKRIRAECFELRWMASPLGYPRVGLIVPKHSQSAVKRNRLKRRLREIMRREILPALGSLDVIIRTQPVAYHVSFDGLRREAVKVGERLIGVAGGERGGDRCGGC